MFMDCIPRSRDLTGNLDQMHNHYASIDIQHRVEVRSMYLFHADSLHPDALQMQRTVKVHRLL